MFPPSPFRIEELTNCRGIVKPFAEVCLDKEEIEEAVKYIPRIVDPLVRVDYFIRVGYVFFFFCS